MVIVGQGYVGLPLAVRAVEAGFAVVGYDTDVERVKRLAAGESYVEDISDEALGAVLRSGRYRPSADPEACAGFDVAVITVPTPLREGNPDLSYIESAAAMLARHPAPRRHRGARVDHLPGHHRGAGRPHPRGRLRPGRRQGLPPRLQP